MRPSFFNHFVREAKTDAVIPSFEAPRMDAKDWGNDLVKSTMDHFQAITSMQVAKPLRTKPNLSVPKSIRPSVGMLDFGTREACRIYMKDFSLTNVGSEPVDITTIR